MMDDMILILQSNLNFIRGLMNWTQKDLSEATRIGTSTLSKIETGDQLMTPEQYILITRAISREVNDVLHLEEDSTIRKMIRYALREKFTAERYFEMLSI